MLVQPKDVASQFSLAKVGLKTLRTGKSRLGQLNCFVPNLSQIATNLGRPVFVGLTKIQ